MQVLNKDGRKCNMYVYVYHLGKADAFGGRLIKIEDSVAEMEIGLILDS
jgi:hypothetical protein